MEGGWDGVADRGRPLRGWKEGGKEEIGSQHAGHAHMGLVGWGWEGAIASGECNAREGGTGWVKDIACYARAISNGFEVL